MMVNFCRRIALDLLCGLVGAGSIKFGVNTHHVNAHAPSMDACISRMHHKAYTSPVLTV